jgi:predicted GIY-YIG superfamily endonuclease
MSGKEIQTQYVPIVAKYFVYLLKSEVSNRTYVGYTINISRRLLQHNGKLVGGAKKTSTKRPWRVVMFVSFEFERTAMQYEFCVHKTRKFKRGVGIANKMKVMKGLLSQERICSTAPLNSELKRVLFFSNDEAKNLWNSI